MSKHTQSCNMVVLADAGETFITIYKAFTHGFGVTAGDASKLEFKPLIKQYQDVGLSILCHTELWGALGFLVYFSLVLFAGITAPYVSSSYLVFSLFYSCGTTQFEDAPYSIFLLITTAVSLIAVILIAKFDLLLLLGPIFFVLKFVFDDYKQYELFALNIIFYLIVIALSSLLIFFSSYNSDNPLLCVLFGIDGSFALITFFYIATGSPVSVGGIGACDVFLMRLEWTRENIAMLFIFLTLLFIGIFIQEQLLKRQKREHAPQAQGQL